MGPKSLVVLFLLSMSWTLRAEVSLEAFPCPEGDSEQVPLHRSLPVWPHVATMMCLEGTVVLEFTVASSGLVKDARVVDTDLLDVLVHPFVGDLGRTAENGGATTDPGKLFEELVHLLEDSVGHWRSGEKGIQFDLAEDQVVFERLLAEASQSHLERREDLHRFMMGFMDYRM